MKIVEEYVFEEGDVFTGKGEGGYLEPEKCNMHVGNCRFFCVKQAGLGFVQLEGDGQSRNFAPEELTDHLKRGNLIYLGNVIKGNGK